MNEQMPYFRKIGLIWPTLQPEAKNSAKMNYDDLQSILNMHTFYMFKTKYHLEGSGVQKLRTLLQSNYDVYF